MNIETGTASLANADSFEDRILYESCPLCGSADITTDRTVDCRRHPSWTPPLASTMTWMSCKSCGHGFTDGHFTDDVLALVFQQVQTNQRPGDAVEKNRAHSAQIVEKVVPFKNSGTWLDVGFGNGSLMFTAKEYGYDVLGLDLREQAVTAMQALGFKAICEDLCNVRDLAPVDVISMADVLEHTPFPKAVLEAARNLLTEDGILFLSMPNADAFLWKNMDDLKTNPYWAELEHYHNFGRARLYDLLEETGFAPRHYGISKRYRCGMEIVAQKTR